MTSPDRAPVTGATRWLGLAGFLVASFAAAGVAVALQGGDVQGFYTGLDLPPWAPPSWLFGPVWTLLYALIAIAAWRVWERAGWVRALTVWAVQLVFNAAWTPAFFNLRIATLALAIIVVLLGLVLVTMALMGRHDGVAVALMVPYAAWVAFATALTVAIWILNPNLR